MDDYWEAHYQGWHVGVVRREVGSWVAIVRPPGVDEGDLEFTRKYVIPEQYATSDEALAAARELVERAAEMSDEDLKENLALARPGAALPEETSHAP